MISKFKTIIDHIKLVYMSYNRPFVIAYSGGKDSSMVLQMVWLAVMELAIEKRKNKIIVISSDTGVENPYILSYLDNAMKNINEYAKKTNMPVESFMISPDVNNTFWVNLIGKGYGAPSQMFRWCTSRLKIDPISKFIEKNVSEYGEVTLVMGARKNESISRDKVLAKKKRDAMGLSLHKTLSGAMVYTPIEEMKTDEVWEFLLEHYQTPYGTNNNILFELYEGAAADGECSLVTDGNTKSCGGGRFGCWTCKPWGRRCHRRCV